MAFDHRMADDDQCTAVTTHECNAFTMFNCSEAGHDEIQCCNGKLYALVEHLTYKDAEFWMYIGIYIGLVLMAGILSGLSLGLLSFDLTTLRVFRDAGKPKDQKYAKRIMPLVKRHHLLLVTLLLANSACVEAMPIFLDKVSDPFTAVIASVTAVLIFGEVLPQAICTRHGLAIGATLAPFVYFLMGVLFVIAYPLAKVLDLILGQEHGTFFRRAELKALVALHGGNSNTDQLQVDTAQAAGVLMSPFREDQLTADEVLIIKGALDMKDKTARHAMIPVNKVFMLNIEARLDDETMTKILDSSYSRIPVYEGSHHQVVGILLVKSLITMDTRNCTPICELRGTSALRQPHFVPDNMSLFDLLNHFQTGKNHLSIVYMSERRLTSSSTRSPSPLPDDILKKLVIGIITLEDIIEELLQEEIFDEADVYMTDVQKMLGIAIAKTAAVRNGRDNAAADGGGLAGERTPPRITRDDYSDADLTDDYSTISRTDAPFLETDSLLLPRVKP